MDVFESILEYTKMQDTSLKHIETLLSANRERFRKELQIANTKLEEQRNKISILHNNVIVINTKLEEAVARIIELKTTQQNDNTSDLLLLESNLESLKHELHNAYNKEDIVRVQINNNLKHKLYLEDIIRKFKTNFKSLHKSITNSMIDLMSFDNINE